MPTRFAASFVVSPAALVLALLPPVTRAGDVALLPEVTLQLAGAGYVPPEDAFAWNTWVGGGAGLLRVNAATAYLTADVETILGRERRAFDANQANYHLEAGLRIQPGRHLVIPFFHHVSRHVVDRPKTTCSSPARATVRSSASGSASLPAAAPDRPRRSAGRIDPSGPSGVRSAHPTRHRALQL